ncbi:MAG TPA: hypothetical protein VGI66_02860 [Streptosporangiaceae bacterium]|jgi:hypothetical protein
MRTEEATRPPELTKLRARRPATTARRGTTTRPEANARLTAVTGLVLLVLFVAEIVTVVLGPRNVLALHIAIGLTLVPLVVLKLASTTWRMVRYYRHDGEYRIKGPPSPMLRVLGPVLTILTAALLASGVVLVLSPHSLYGAALFVHKKTFYLWLAAFALHTVAHFSDAMRLTRPST